jgi:hypothetical protein
VVRKPEGKRSLESPRHRLQDTKMDLKEIGCELDSFFTGQGPQAGSCEYGNKPSNSIKGGEFLNWVSDYWLLKKNSAPIELVGQLAG